MGIETVVADKSQISDTKNKTLTSERFFIVLSFCVICAFAQDNSLPFHQYSDELDSWKYSLLEVESKFKNNWNNWLLHELRTSSTNSTLKYGVAKWFANEKSSNKLNKQMSRTWTRDSAKIVKGVKSGKGKAGVFVAISALMLYVIAESGQPGMIVIASLVLMVLGIMIGVLCYCGRKNRQKEVFERR